VKAPTPTQNDVARLAKVSHTTISRYINNKGHISPDVKERIKSAIEDLNYKPNMFAQGLKSRRSMTLGVIFPDIVNPFFSNIFKSVEDIAHRNGYNVILCITDENAEKEIDYLKVLKTRAVDGYLIVPSPSDDYTRYNILQGHHIVYAVRKPALENIICYKNADDYALRLAVEHLIALGHRRIGIINLPLTIPPARERLEGYRQTLRMYNIPVDNDLIRYSPFSMDVSYHETMALLELPTRPTALISANMSLVLGSLRALKDKKLAIPSDISLIGVDDFETSSLLDPPLTTVALQVCSLGELAIHALLNLVQGNVFEPKTIELYPELIVRESTWPANDP